jgi:AAA domain
MIYGEAGAGKSTFGARSDKPVFISPEGGTDQLFPQIDEIPGITNWDTLLLAIKKLITEEHEFKTLVLDSADWIEALAHKKIIGNTGRSIITVGSGYGHGFRESQTMHQNLIENLGILREKRGMHIVLTAHSHVKPVKDPAMLEDYDCFEPKMHELVSSLWKEWTDGFFFVRFRTFLRTSDETKARAMGDGTRVVYTVKQPAFHAKNRFGMEPEYEFTLDFWETVKTCSQKGETAEQLLAEIEELLKSVTDENIIATTKTAIAGGRLSTIEAYRNRLRQVVKKQK